MSKQALCYLVIGASLGVIVRNLARRHKAAALDPPRPAGSGEVIDFATWKKARVRAVAFAE